MGKKKSKEPVFDPANLPGVVYVTLFDNGEKGDPNAYRELEEIEAGAVVGVYELIRIAKLDVVATLEDI